MKSLHCSTLCILAPAIADGFPTNTVRISVTAVLGEAKHLEKHCRYLRVRNLVSICIEPTIFSEYIYIVLTKINSSPKALTQDICDKLVWQE